MSDGESTTGIVRIGAAGPLAHRTGGRVSVADERTVTHVLQGPYGALLEMVPAKGDKWSPDGRAPLRTVSSATLEPRPGRGGLLKVTCLLPSMSARTDPESGEETEEEREEVVLEVESAQLEKPLLSHPRFSGLAEEIELWRAAAPALRAAYRYADAGGEERELSERAREAAELILRGVESYIVFSPVARRTTNRPSGAPFAGIGAGCGRKEGPGGALAGMVAGTWQWLKTGDRASQSSIGSSQRVEEWTGADEWSEALYGGDGPAGGGDGPAGGGGGD